MAASQQTIIAQTGAALLSYTLEFRTWNGSAYVWTDYTDRLLDFSGIGATVEEGAFPNAFRMNVGRVVLDNTDGMFDNLDALDGLLYNSAEPYGQSIYKRMLRIKCNGTAIGVALVRDVKPRSNKNSVVIETISLDARAADQSCDGETAERHPLGSTDKASESLWTTTVPASLTGNVNMYRWRDEEVEGNLSYGWFKDRHYAEIIERTAWALDDLATDITETYRLMTSDATPREIATTRNIPPDDPAVSEGVTPDRCRVVIWNPERNVLVCCVGHKIYDYDPTVNTYTLRNTLTTGRDVVRAFYTTEADSAGKNKRIVLVQTNITNYVGSSGTQVSQSWCTVLDATGIGAYTLLDNQHDLGTDVFPGTHLIRESDATNGSTGQYLLNNQGENDNVPFRQFVKLSGSGFTTPDIWHTDDSDWTGTKTIFGESGTVRTVLGNDRILPRGYMASNVQTNADGDLKYSHGNMFCAVVSNYTAGGKLWFFTFNNIASPTGWRMRSFNLNNYTLGSYVALGGAATRVPYALYAPQDATYNKRLYVCQMQFKNTATDYSIGELYYYDLNTAAWANLTFLSGATGNNQAWMVTEVVHHDYSGSPILSAILFNRETLKWRFCFSLGLAPNDWTFTDSQCLAGFLNGQKDQENRLEGLYENVNYATKKVFFVEAGPNLLWSCTTVLVKENVTPAGAANPDPINADRGLGSYFTSTGVNYPDSATPNGIMFWISAADYIDAGADHPNGRYALCQYANFDPGFIQLLDVSGLSFWELRTLIAEAFGFVHYYSGDGTLIFKPRTTSGAASFTFSEGNRNYIPGEVQTRGFEAILNDITVKPYAVVSERRMSDIIGRGSETLLDRKASVDFPPDGASSINGNPGENSQWRLVFVSPTTYDLYKIEGTNFSVTVAKATAKSIDSILRSPTDGIYLTIAPDAFSGVFLKDDNFTFWVFEPDERLEVLGESDISHWDDPTSIAKYKRNSRTFENRFIRRQIAPDYAANIGTWRSVRHDIIRIEAAADPAYQPLLRCTFTDANMGYSAITAQIMGVENRKLAASTLTLAKV